MTQITVSGEVSQQLAEARERIEVRDSKGQFWASLIQVYVMPT